VQGAPLDITIEQGRFFSLPLTYEPQEEPADLTGYQAHMQIRPTHGSDELIADLSSEDDPHIFFSEDRSDGQVTVEIPDTETQEMDFNRAVYDLKLTPPAGKPFTLVKGVVVLEREVTE
jgi:hypothetical protein